MASTDGEPISRTRTSRPLATAVLALAATVLSFAALEAALRVAGIDAASAHAIGGFTIYDPVLGWRLAPGRDGIFRTPSFTTRVVQNATGLRDRDYAEARTPGRRRILVLGDSFVWCWGVDQARCFTEQLESRLSDVDVINAGVPAYSTAQEMLYYERDLRRYRPDLVLLVFVPNDPFENAAGDGPRFRLVDGRLVAPAGPVPRRKPATTEWLQAHSRVWAQAMYLIAVVRDTARMWCHAGTAHAAPEPPGFVPAGALPSDKAWMLTEALLDRLGAAVHADGARLALVFEEMPAPMIDRLRAYCTARGLPCLELGPAFAAARTRGVDIRFHGDPHVAPAGQTMVTDAVETFLREATLLP